MLSSRIYDYATTTSLARQELRVSKKQENVKMAFYRILEE